MCGMPAWRAFGVWSHDMGTDHVREANGLRLALVPQRALEDVVDRADGVLLVDNQAATKGAALDNFNERFR